jgi:isoleucyl-tRNA synthetase
VHLETWPAVHAAWHDAALGERWEAVRAVRAEVFARLEQLRRDKVIGSSLEATVTLLLDGNSFKKTEDVDWAEVLIVGSAQAAEATPEPESADGSLVHNVAVMADVERSRDSKCGRCWRHLPDVPEEGALCRRCSEVVDG